MLLADNGDFVYGNNRGIAWSADITKELQILAYKEARLGLDSSTLKNREAVGFFPIKEKELLIVCRYQSSPLYEYSSRGLPTFTEYIFVTSKQLRLLKWNLLALEIPSG